MGPIVDGELNIQGHQLRAVQSLLQKRIQYYSSSSSSDEGKLPCRTTFFSSCATFCSTAFPSMLFAPPEELWSSAWLILMRIKWRVVRAMLRGRKAAEKRCELSRLKEGIETTRWPRGKYEANINKPG